MVVGSGRSGGVSRTGGRGRGESILRCRGSSWLRYGRRVGSVVLSCLGRREQKRGRERGLWYSVTAWSRVVSRVSLGVIDRCGGCDVWGNACTAGGDLSRFTKLHHHHLPTLLDTLASLLLCNRPHFGEEQKRGGKERTEIGK